MSTAIDTLTTLSTLAVINHRLKNIRAGGPPSAQGGPGSGNYEHKKGEGEAPPASTPGAAPAGHVWPAVMKGQTTEDVFKNQATGNWDRDPARKAWHEAFADDAIAGKTPAVGRPPRAIILGGGTASGKSTLANKLGADDPNMVHVDADGIKPKIPEHPQFLNEEGDPAEETQKRNPNLASSRVHEESSYLAKLILSKAISHKLDIIYDATSSGKGGGTLTGIVNSLHARGYEVHGLFADVPVDVAAQRAEARAANPADPAGFRRHIPVSALTSTHIGAAANFMMMKDSPMFDSMKLFDTSGGMGDAPKPIYTRNPGEKEGTVNDESKWDYYKRKAASTY